VQAVDGIADPAQRVVRAARADADREAMLRKAEREHGGRDLRGVAAIERDDAAAEPERGRHLGGHRQPTERIRAAALVQPERGEAGRFDARGQLAQHGVIGGADETDRDAHKRFSILVLPRVLGLTLARSRNSATPSSGDSASCAKTSGETSSSPIGSKP